MNLIALIQVPRPQSWRRHLVAAAFGFLLSWGSVFGAELDVRRDATVEAVERVLPSVVNISTKTQVERRGYYLDWWRDTWAPFSQKLPPQYSAGSGVIIHEDGYVLTNVHVVEDAHEISAKLSDGRIIQAEVIQGTAKTDVALLKLRGQPGEKFTAARFATADDLLLGETVIALGNPFGLGGSVSRGILSSKNRRTAARDEEGLDVPDWLQTDASINPGNSGGPLINLRGEVIGINVAVAKRGQGIGFAVPIKLVVESLADIFTPEALNSLWFGARVTGSLPLKVEMVLAGSPADKAGLRAGDLIVEIDNKQPKSFIDFSSELMSAGDERAVSLIVQRVGARKTLSLRLVPETSFFNADLIKQKIGASLQQLTPELADRFRIKTSSGLIIAGVEKNSPADEADLQKRYLILGIDGRTTTDLTTAAKVLYAKKKGEKAILSIAVERTNGAFFSRETGRVSVAVR